MSGAIEPGAVAELFDEEVLEQYDLVGFDPRGMDLDCFDSPEEREELMADISDLPLTSEEEQETLDALPSTPRPVRNLATWPPTCPLRTSHTTLT